MNAQIQANAQETKTSNANKAPKQAKQAASTPVDVIVQDEQASPVSNANVPFPTILYPRTDSKGEARKQVPFIRTEGRTVLAKIGGVELKMEVPESDAIGVHDVVTCRATKVTGAYSVDAMPMQIPAIVFFACGLAGMAERLNTNAESRDAFEAQVQAWQGCYPMPSDERALNTRPAFTWGSFMATYQPTDEQLPVWAALRGKTTTELAKLTKGLRERCDWLRVAMDAAGYTEPTQVAIPDDLAALLG